MDLLVSTLPGTSTEQLAVGCAPDADVEKNVTVAVTTDKGLCGGINSTVCRYVRGMSHMYAAGAQPCLSKRCDAALSSQ